MRVLHVVPSLLPESGGPSRTVPELCRALTSQGTNVTLFSTHVPGEGLTIDQKQTPYEVILFPAADGSWAGARQIQKAIRDRALEFDLIHIHSLWNLTVTLSAAAARSAGQPYVLAPRGMLTETCLQQSSYSLKRAYARVYDYRTIEGATRLHFLNADEAQASQSARYRYPESFVAPNGIDVNLKGLRPGGFRARFPEFQGRRLMLFLGRLHPIKGLDVQLHALERLVATHADLIWVLVGPDDGEWPRLRRLIRSAEMEKHVRWIGQLTGDERFSALIDADVVLQTSFYECQSTTVSEALAVGVPLVVTDSINYREVQATGAGYVVSRDAQQLADAVEAVLTAPDLGESMRSAGRRFAAAELSWSRIATIVNAAYEEAIASATNQNKIQESWPDTQIQAKV